ncbi:glycine--tRNA ligase subunit beta [Geothermobacter hydrogeniphilus]|uniref:Glycine--tRNA ligase beta subunit n=1 Tax=Geothermobacter hydrogeniphilus TaxID=1969733 RepID=A0A1X0XW85_9BACT|nr:glycine--tRNA ligase subunit beta [Geothermobacter hydrogeniphilus]ORJ57152.1 glycine--tRNA ligase subunit beta [Geothermobacter hydrogeniphilus]
MSSELFLEIGTEEIPAGFLNPARRDLERLLRKEFAAAGLACGAIRTFATPRRIAIAVADLAAETPRQELKLTGPSLKVAFDADGKPTRAALGFARSNGVDVSDLGTIETDKGAYVAIDKVIEGKPTCDLLPEILERTVTGLPFRKSMRWKDLDVRFARPVHWIVALYDGRVVPFGFGNLTSGDQSRGHRFMAPESFTVSGCEQWLAELEKRFVIADPEKRRALIADGVKQAAEAIGGVVNLDEKLLDEITYLVEDPTPVAGGFEADYLQLPRELLVTSMREHQRYFTVSDADGRLLPNFITVSNTRAEDLSVVARGNERVLRARLSDAMFFWTEDQKVKLETRLEALKKVVYQQKLGTSYEKVMRFTALARGLAEQFEPEAVAQTERAALLAKCDLETGMVYEFPELQGVMGCEYARLEGEDERVATAIYEHYLPIEAGGDLPTDSVGAFVSIADKIDTICGCFGVGLIPTGSADPYALRRSAIGVLNILQDRGYRLSLAELIGRGVGLLGEKLTRPADEVVNDVLAFFRGRFQNMQGEVPADVVDAVLAAGFDDPLDAWARIEALAALKGQADFEPLAVAFKRVVNIIKGGTEAAVDPALFESQCEGDLLAAQQLAAQRVAEQVANGDYAAALQTIAGLRPAVDAFFDGVMVMAENAAVKTNRLALLTMVAELFAGIADFARIS